MCELQLPISSFLPPPAQPGLPVVTVIATTDSTITLTWHTTLHYFESEMFTFVVIWNEIGSSTSTNVTTSSPPYTISGLQPGTSYQISVHGVDGSGITAWFKECITYCDIYCNIKYVSTSCLCVLKYIYRWFVECMRIAS